MYGYVLYIIFNNCNINFYRITFIIRIAIYVYLYILYHFVHDIILAHFWDFRLIILFAYLLYFCNLYVQDYQCGIISY